MVEYFGLSLKFVQKLMQLQLTFSRENFQECQNSRNQKSKIS